ncbi:MAG: hypothetical protein ACE5H3_00165 [Planctomycetota bacterium]
MPSETSPTDPQALLRDLELRARSDPRVSREWEQAEERFPSFRRKDSGWVARFREWFLLERTSEILGLPPAAAWAPDFVEPESAWERLLESFLGIFQVSRDPDSDSFLLEDLWSRRMIPVRPEGLESLAVPGALGFGRFHPGEQGDFLPMPGFEIHLIPELGGALRRDLARLRAENPRRRLSQLELEQLLAPFLEGVAGKELQGIEARLGRLLRDAPGLSLQGLRHRIREEGAAGVLDLMAFQTRLDLEPFRILFPAWERELAHVASRTADAGEETPPRNPRIPVAEALQKFDQGRRAGRSLDGLFAALEEDLGLEVGASNRPESRSPEEPAAGSAPPFETWVLTYSWERQAKGSPLSPAEKTALETLDRFLTGQKGRMEIRTLSPGMVLAFFLSARNPAELDGFRQNLADFLGWVVREQEAPLEDLLADLAGPYGEHLRQVVCCNQELAATAPPPKGKARVCSSQPLQVLDEEEQACPAGGIPPVFGALPRPEDLLLGSWQGGRFRVSRLIPAEVLRP